MAEQAQSNIAVLRQDLQQMETQFKAALPAHIPVERFGRVVMTAIQNNPDLVNKVDRRSLWNAAMKAAQDGLLPDGREGAIVAYGSQATWMPMIAGLRKKARNSGELVSWEAYVVHENDDFAFELGDEPYIKHRPSLTKEPGAVIGAYSIAVLKDGYKSREVMSVGAIEKVRTRSKAKSSGPWMTDYEEMCRKTVARRHSKVLPMSTDLDDLLRRDDDLYQMQEAKEDAPERLKSLSGRLDALAKPAADVIELSPNGTEPPSESQGAAPSQPGPVSDGDKPAPAEAKPSSPDEAKAGAGAREPQTEAEYGGYFHAWLAKAKDAEEARKRWKSEAPMRERCNVDNEMDEAWGDELHERIAGLKGKK